MTDGIEETDETCEHCGATLLKVEPAELTDGPHDRAFICPPDDGCGVVDRYE